MPKLILLPIMGVCTLFCQTLETPSVGEPAILYLFLRHHDSLVKNIQQASVTDAAAAVSRKKTVAASLHVSVEDFDKINPIYKQ